MTPTVVQQLREASYKEHRTTTTSGGSVSEATKTEPTVEAKAEAVLASLMALTDTTPGGVALVGVKPDGDFSKKEGLSYNGGGRTWVITVPEGEGWTGVVDALYQMLCTTRGREWR